MKRILGFLRPYARRMSLGFAIKFIGTIGELWLPWILTHMINNIVPLQRLGLIFLWGGLMVFCSGVCVAANITANRMASAVARDTTRAVRHSLYERIAYLSCAQIDRVGVPSLVSRLTTDTYNVHQMVGMIQRLGVRAPIMLVGGILMTLTLDVPSTLILLATVPLIGISVTYVSMKGIPLFQKLQTSIDALVRIVRENITGARVIKALSRGEHEVARFGRQNAETSGREVRANIVMGLGQPIMNILLNAGMVAVILLGARRVYAGQMEPGTIVAFLSYFTIIAGAMMGLTRLFVIFSRSNASANRIAEILDMPADLAVVESPASDSPWHVEFDDVSFSYNKRGHAVEHISFRLRRGESLGIIGATGSGKTTIVNLLMRFYDVDSGAVRIDGRDVRSIDEETLHTMFGVAFQSDAVFSDTVRENIALGRAVSQEDIDRAIENAQAGYIASLADGQAQHLNAQGTNLSGGQRQRLLIARALAGHPDILILDDSSSALDYRTDADLRLALRKNYSDVTSILIASRVSSIAHCTQIIVMDEGRVIGQGTHQELLKSCPVYADIAKTQMGGGLSA
ncbi:MAG: ABC transporter ATP-binding protein [Clostridia bacterium]|nr:ABC transporter ATP-binding protein [Clostridia bacterium]